MENKQVKKIKKQNLKKQYLRFFKLMKKFEQLLKIRFTENNDFMMRKENTLAATIFSAHTKNT